MSADVGAQGLEILSVDECRRLLAHEGLGRLGLPGPDAPLLRPVNFVLHDDTLVVRTGPGRILTAAQRGDPAALEIDGIDRVEHTGWSVIATGKLSELAADGQARALRLRPWAAGGRDRYVALSLESVSGRRIPIGRGSG
jgi:nitroimidazol reductase NimA-like FMN-containing flavoprotein (pyridoxamine 5'-phosphate oxidase superfamily)